MTPTIVLDPSKMANLVAWYRADQYDAAAGTCTDLGSNGYTMTFVTNKPTKSSSDALYNNKPSVTHTGGTSMLTNAAVAFGSVSTFEIWAVYKYTGTTTAMIVEFGNVGSITNSWAMFHRLASPHGAETYLHGNVGNQSIYITPDPAAVKALASYGDQSLAAGAEVGILQNNVGGLGTYSANSGNNTATFGTQNMNIGGRTGGTNQFVGSWADILVFKANLSTAIRNDLYNNYLQPRYNL